jgi:uncharacterized protein (DUF302 family)
MEQGVKGSAVEPGIGRTVTMSFGAALEKTEMELQKEGFGILTRIDVRETLKKKLGVEQAPFVILGACNPPLAHRALQAAPEIGLLLPCNVVVRDLGQGRTRVEAINPHAMVALFPEAALHDVAHEVADRLTRVIAGL